MNYQNPPLRNQAKNATHDYDHAAEKDARLQADPELASSEGSATLPWVAIYFAAMAFIVCVVLWGLNHQRDETVTNASAPATEAPANDAGQAPQQQGNAPTGQQQSQNPPPKQQSQGQQPPAQQKQPANAQQQNAPAPKQ